MAGDFDLTEFLKEGSGTGPADLDWLDVDEATYQAVDTLPQQNLDIVPELKALWDHEDGRPSKLVPNTGAPRATGGFSSMLASSDDIVRTARLAVMQSPEPQSIVHALQSRYDSGSIQSAKTALSSVLAERGLLGRYYVDAEDFPACDQSGKAAKFVQRFAKDARYVKAKLACVDCQHRRVQADGSERCSVFHKQIVMEVPYTEEIADAVEETQEGQGRKVEAADGSAKERIRFALLAKTPNSTEFSGHRQAKPKAAAFVTKEQLREEGRKAKAEQDDQQSKVAAQKARPIVALLRREMLKGRSFADLKQALRLGFDEHQLKAAAPHWLPLYKQAGLYGAIYSTQDSFDDCREGADFLNKHSSSVRAIVAGDKCGSCIFNKVGRCMMYGRKLVKEAGEILSAETVTAVLDEQKLRGNLPIGGEKIQWGETPSEALKAIHHVATSPQVPVASLRANIEQAFHGQGQAHVNKETTQRAIITATQQYLNEGLYGQDLLTLLQGQFEVRDLTAAEGPLRKVLAEQGLQGIKYIDPRVYADYGKGCKTAASKHRSRAAVKYAKIGDKCSSCVHQTRPGHCSILKKQLVVEPPYMDKAAEQKAILGSGASTEIDQASLVNNGLTTMQEYGLQHQEDFDLNPVVPQIDAVVQFGSGDQKVKL